VESETGIADPALTDVGHLQARQLVAWLMAEPLHHIAVSPLQRARQTAAPLAAQFGLEAQVIAELAEFDAAASSYIPIEEMKATRDPRLQAMTEGRWDQFGSEIEPDAFRSMVVAVIDGVAAVHPGESAAVVCHWQSSVAVAIGTVVGIPLGIVLGRVLWDLFAHGLHMVPDPSVPVLTVLFVALGALVLANVIAALPGRMAARTPTALLLRAE
jgi:2,3-bisphosphoglycerate-dependent phosphoglycerate mutase